MLPRIRYVLASLNGPLCFEFGHGGNAYFIPYTTRDATQTLVFAGFAITHDTAL